MTSQSTTPLLLFITKDPSHPIAHHALRFATSALKLGKQVDVFFYANGASTANGFRWQSADQPNMSKQWSQLATEYNLNLAVCVSTALARGVTDAENAKRHDLDASSDANNITSNIADGFRLVGLSEFVMKMDSHTVIQF